MKCLPLLLLSWLPTTTFAVDYEGEGSEHIQDDVFTCPDTNLTFRAPDLKTDNLRIVYQEITPDITWRLSFVEELGHMGSVTFTKIRDEYLINPKPTKCSSVSRPTSKPRCCLKAAIWSGVGSSQKKTERFFSVSFATPGAENG